MRTIERTTRLDAQPADVWRHVLTPRLLDHVAHPLLRFGHSGALDPAAEWPAGEHYATLQLFGVVPIGWQIIGIEVPQTEGATDKGRRLLRDNGRGPLIARWDHWIVVAPAHDSAGTVYTDRVHIEAGWRTPMVAAFADRFYAHRQRRWRELARTNFAALRS